jgi:YnbE-like lipoprotein
MFDGPTERARSRRLATAALMLIVLQTAALEACTPTVQMAAPKDPITINLNIKLDAEVRFRVEQKAKEDVQTKPIF